MGMAHTEEKMAAFAPYVRPLAVGTLLIKLFFAALRMLAKSKRLKKAQAWPGLKTPARNLGKILSATP
jgi:hypothetical protein